MMCLKNAKIFKDQKTDNFYIKKKIKEPYNKYKKISLSNVSEKAFKTYITKYLMQIQIKFRYFLIKCNKKKYL